MKPGAPNKPLCRTPVAVNPINQAKCIDYSRFSKETEGCNCKSQPITSLSEPLDSVQLSVRNCNCNTNRQHRHTGQNEEISHLHGALNKICIKSSGQKQSRGHLLADKCAFPCALGKTGLTRTKQEGDGATPRLLTRPLYGFYRADREAKPRSRLPFYPLRSNMGWCDAPAHPSYNRLVHLPCPDSHENMWREDALYDLVLVLDINFSERIRGRGSALFIHVTRPGYLPTDGCIALSKPHLRQILNGLTRQTRIRIGG